MESDQPPAVGAVARVGGAAAPDVTGGEQPGQAGAAGGRDAEAQRRRLRAQAAAQPVAVAGGEGHEGEMP